MNNWYDKLIKDCQELLDKQEQQTRAINLNTYHQLGKRIQKDKKKFAEGGEAVTEVAISLRKSKELVWYSVQLAKKYPSLDKLPEEISWQSVRKYLPKPPQTETSVANGLVTPDFHREIDSVVMAAANLSEILDNIPIQMRPEEHDYLFSQLKQTMGKIGVKMSHDR